MSNNQVQEAMALMSKLTMEQIQAVMHANNEALNIAAMLSQPSPPLGSKHVQAIAEGWKGEQKAQLGQLAMRGQLLMRSPSQPSADQMMDNLVKRYVGPEVYELHKTYQDGTQAWKGVSRMNTLDNTELLAKSAKHHEAVLKASQKVGIPKSREDIQTHNLAKTALLRSAANAASVNMAATALFDIKTLFDGEFQKYFVKLGISGVYGGAVSGIQATINHPVIGHGAVVGVVVGSAFGVVGLVNTGDWARFGKNTGLNIAGSAAGLGGSQLGAMAGTAVFGPFGTVLGGLIGGFFGGLAGRWTAGKTTNLAELTNLEVEDLYDTVMKGNAKMGVSVDPSLTKREVVTRTFGQGGKSVNVRMTDAMAADITGLQETITEWQLGDPEGFVAFVDGLRKAAQH